MKLQSSPMRWLLPVVAVFGLMLLGTVRAAADMKLEALLIWGTNDEKSPNPDHKPVEPSVEEKLKKLPFKWNNYFEVTRKVFVVSKNGSDAVELSKSCEIKVRNPSSETLEVTLFGKGKEVSRTTQALPKGELLVIGGNAENVTAWFVVIRQIE